MPYRVTARRSRGAPAKYGKRAVQGCQIWQVVYIIHGKLNQLKFLLIIINELIYFLSSSRVDFNSHFSIQKRVKNALKLKVKKRDEVEDKVLNEEEEAGVDDV